MEQSLQYVELLQGRYNYLYLGKFLEQVIMHNDLSPYAENIPISTTGSQRFVLNGTKIKDKLHVIYKNPGKKNIFGYLTELSSFRGIFGVMKEVVDDASAFQKFMQKTLGTQYFHFEHIVRFVRNCLAHATSVHIDVKEDDFIKQKDFLAHRDVHAIHLRFLYKDHISQRSGSDAYGIDIAIDFAKLKSGMSFRDIVPLHELYLLSELSYNLSELYRAKIQTAKVSKAAKLSRSKQQVQKVSDSNIRMQPQHQKQIVSQSTKTTQLQKTTSVQKKYPPKKPFSRPKQSQSPKPQQSRPLPKTK